MSGIRKYLIFTSALAAVVALTPSCRDDENDGLNDNLDVQFDVSLSEPALKGVIDSYTELKADTVVNGKSYVLGVSVSGCWPGEEPATKAAVETTASLQNSTSGFGLFETHGSTGVLSNAQYTYDNTSAAWKPASDQFATWPVSGGATFRAYAPYDEGGSVTGEKITFVANPINSSQKDLLVAAKTYLERPSDGRAVLKFKHALTAVRFVAGEGIDLTIKSVEFTGLKNQGEYSFESGEWGNLSGSENFAINFATARHITGSEDLPEITYTENTDPHNEYFLLLPQEFPDDNAKIIITLADETSLEFNIHDSGTKWEPGKLVTYKLKDDNGNYNFEFSNNIYVNYQGEGVNSFTVTSTKDDKAQPYTIEYLKEGSIQFLGDGSIEETDTEWSADLPDNIKAWLKELTSSVFSDEGQQTVTASLQATLPITENATIPAARIHEEIAEREPLGTQANPIDLSYNRSYSMKGGMNTANCYVINEPGWYMFPCVYGNAIYKSRIKLPYAGEYFIYNPSSLPESERVGLPPADIPPVPIIDSMAFCADPYTEYISNPWVSADRAELLWQDANGLITNLELIEVTLPVDLQMSLGRSTLKYIRFKVPVHEDRPSGYINKYVPEGNCLIAAKNANTIEWSWHIWVTGRDLRHDVTEHEVDRVKGNDLVLKDNSLKIHFAPVELGFCSAGDMTADYYPAHKTFLRLTQQGSGWKLYVRVYQKMHIAGEISATGYAPYYLWGIKNPLPPAIRTDLDSYQQLTLYNIDGNVITTGIPNDGTYSRGDESGMSSTVQQPTAVHHVYNEGGGYWKEFGRLWSGFKLRYPSYPTKGWVVPNINAYKDDDYKSINDPCPAGMRVPESNSAGLYWSSHASDVLYNWHPHLLGYRFSTYGFNDVGTKFYYFTSDVILKSSYTACPYGVIGSSYNSFNAYTDHDVENTEYTIRPEYGW